MWLSSTYQEELYKKYKGLKFSPFFVEHETLGSLFSSSILKNKISQLYNHFFHMGS